MRCIYIFVCVCALTFLSACIEQQDSRLESALNMAGANKGELLKVLNRYRESDNQKYHAACFLIKNMPYYGFYEGKELQKYLRYFEAHSTNIKGAQFIVYSLKKADGEFSIDMFTRKKDIEVVDSAFLVEHIEWAFKVWKEQPWGENVNFDDFCEYILPYRVGDEPLSLWRKELYDKYNPLLDKFRKSADSNDITKAAQILMDTLRQGKYRYTSLFPKGPHIGPVALKWKTGSCREFADAMIYVMRALGVPCGMDRVIQRGDTNASHFWNFILDKDRNTYMAEFPYQENWKKASEYDITKGKVYRVTYSLNEELTKELKDVPSVHPIFRYPFFHDVTATYLGQQNGQIVIPQKELYDCPRTGELVYLCFANKQEWVPVACTFFDGKAVCFDNVEGGIVAILATYNEKGLQILSNPFTLNHDTGEIHYLNPLQESHIISVYKKFYFAVKNYFNTRMIGGVIEGSNQKDFQNVDTLLLIKEAPYRLYTVAYLDPDRAYRYVRYRGGKGSYCNIAELSFYENSLDTLPMKGKIIGTPGCYGDDGRREYTNVFDGNPDTSFDYKFPDTGWAGLDLGKSYRVSKAIYTPRNDVSFIYKDNIYELFYWDKGNWNSLGRQTAVADSLVYTVPRNALLYLKNHTTGNDERIFEYEGRRQIFW